MALLRLIKGFAPGKTFPLNESSYTLGRAHDCEIQLDAASVSRRHVRIFRRGGDWYIEDLKSRNGTLLNNRPVLEPTRLNHRDRIQVCSIVLYFYADGREHETGGIEEFQAKIADMGPEDQSSYMATFDMLRQKHALGQTMASAEVKLRALVEIGRHLGEAVQVEEVLMRILDSLFVIFPQADRGIIVLREPNTNILVPKALKQRNPNHDEVRLSRTILQNVISTGQAILSADAAQDSRFDMAQSISHSPIRSMMCAPLVGIDGNAIGVLQIDAATTMRQFTSQDLEILASVANQATVAVRNAQLMESAMAEASIRRELNVAHKVQQGFLPAMKPSVNGYEFFDYYSPARQLGGDYFDYVPLQDGRLAVILGDVSGKGISASLLMAKMSAEARYLLAMHPNLADAMFALNNTFCDDRWGDRFITVAAGVLDPKTHDLELVNAGHVPPMLCRPNMKPQALKMERTFPIGVFPDSTFPVIQLRLQPGDTLFFFTDGATDGINKNAEMFGMDRLCECWTPYRPTIQEQGDALIQAISDFVGDVPYADDICVTGIRRKL
ncbi:MAG: SpoIIE family protein phosphatase [Thermoguttaceae bacterium]|nr:SpoIIE family protein phosphatase [Thermoguttaceae bacterium]